MRLLYLNSLRECSQGRGAVHISLFLIIGITVIAFGIYKLKEKGGVFIGTSKALYHGFRGKVIIYDWSQFIDEVKVSGDRYNPGVIMLRLKSQKPVAMIGLENAVGVVEKIERRIRGVS